MTAADVPPGGGAWLHMVVSNRMMLDQESPNKLPEAVHAGGTLSAPSWGL